MIFKKIFEKLFGKYNNQILKNMYNIVDLINKIEPDFKNLSDSQLKNKTLEFRTRIDKGEKLNNLIIEAFATVREASKRIFHMRHFDVQILGGIVLHQCGIAEMRTGEGKTLTSTLPAYLNALTKKGVHIVTVNDYLAQRDAKDNEILFSFLGMKVGVNLSYMNPIEKRKAYLADITYGTNNEYGFDYLKDNMVLCSKDRVQRKLHYALIDEVDSILIDEARTPLIISEPTEENSEMYIKINKIIPYLIRQEKEDSDTFQGKGHFSVDEKSRQVYLTERGLNNIENLFIQYNLMHSGESLYSPKNIILIHHVISALRAHVLFKKNIDYIVKNKKIIIVDEHTGRIMHGRRWSDGLHQAIEAKEFVEVQNENQTLASITFQNYFRLYEKLAGMTGTAETESHEFKEIYKLNTFVIPTNKPMIRRDFSDLIYMTEKEKQYAIIQDIKKRTKIGQPILVGTISIKKSEIISRFLKKIGIKHNILNAKFHAKEAEIIAQAGKPNAVTIATNMAGRGTDIVLGGCWKAELQNLKNPTKTKIKKIKSNWKIRHAWVLSLGGLHIIGTERHESRRIDNQLRGRAGRQGDPGSSRFYLSMEDSMMRIFASEKILFMMKKLGMKEHESIEHHWVNKAIENAQKKVENYNFEIRKQLLEYDNVTNEQRKVIYSERNQLLEISDMKDIIENMRYNVFTKLIDKYIHSFSEKENFAILKKILKDDFNLDISITNLITKNKRINKKILYNYILKKNKKYFLKKEKFFGKDKIRFLEKKVILKTLDSLWKEHLMSMEYLRQGIHLRGYAQKDPKQEYKRESFMMFNTMLDTLNYEIIKTLSNINIK